MSKHNQVTKPAQITPKTDALMREIANLMWDRMFDDLKNDKIKFKKESKKLQNEPKERVIKDKNTT